MGFIIALLSGALMSVQGVFNSEVTKQTGIWTASAFVQLTAFFACVAAWAAVERDQSLLSVLKVSPKYLLFGGLIGAVITFTVIKSISCLGPAKSAMLIVAAQLVVSYIVELFGLFGIKKVDFSWTKVVGVGLFLAGIFIFKWKS